MWCRRLVASITKRPDQRGPVGIRKRTRVLVITGVTFACLSVGATLGAVVVLVPRWQVAQIDKGLTPAEAAKISPLERAVQINECRRTLNETLACVGVGVATLLGGWYYKRRDNAARQADRGGEHEKQLEARYEKAVDQLGSAAEATRVGAIRTLGRLLHESPERHWTLVTVLTAFVCQRTRPRPTPGQPAAGQETMAPCPTDVQQALRVLGSRPRRAEPGPLDFSWCVLANAELSGNFVGANFCGADLRGARFTHRDLRGVNLEMALVRAVDQRTWPADQRGHESGPASREELRQARLARREQADALRPSSAATEYMLAERRWELAYGPRKTRSPGHMRRESDRNAGGDGGERRSDDAAWPAESSGPLDSPL
jgi:hypothetical protein